MWRATRTLPAPIAAASQSHEMRDHLFLELRSHGHAGWGEVTPQPTAVLGDAPLESVEDDLVRVALPTLLAVAKREGAPPTWTRANRLGRAVGAATWSAAVIEMALLDWELRRAQRALEDLWPPLGDRVLVNATTSLVQWRDEWSPPEGADRIRLKTVAGADVLSRRDAVARWARPVLLDFNGSADDAGEVHRQVRDLGPDVEIAAVEQPFAPGDLMSMASLAESLAVPLSVDEGARSVRDVRQVARYRAAALVCIKPPRVGGAVVARAMADEARKGGLRPYVGGFFESSLARRCHAALAAATVTEPSDVTPVEHRGERDERVTTGLGVLPNVTDATLLFDDATP